MSRRSLAILACTLVGGLLPAALPAATLAAAPGAGAPHRVPGPAPHRKAPAVARPRNERVSLLYVLNAGSGTLTPKPGAAGRYTLSLHGLDQHSVWFSDRPARRSGAFLSKGFAAAWKGFGFAADPPNAALVYTDPATGRERTVILELTHPTYRQGHALSFDASVVDPSKAGEDLAAHARSADREPASRLANPSLFVDDTSAPVVGSCVLQPYTVCNEANISNVNLSGIDLKGAFLEGANLSNDNLAGAEMKYDVLIKANLDGDDLEGATMEYDFVAEASLKGANLMHTNLSRAEAYDADLEDASLYEAEVSFTNFESSNFTNGTLEGATAQETNIDGTYLGGCSIAYVRWY